MSIARNGWSRFNPAYRAELQAERDAEPTRTTCARCGQTHEGTAAEGREWFRAHRATCPGQAELHARAHAREAAA